MGFVIINHFCSFPPMDFTLVLEILLPALNFDEIRKKYGCNLLTLLLRIFTIKITIYTDLKIIKKYELYKYQNDLGQHIQPMTVFKDKH